MTSPICPSYWLVAIGTSKDVSTTIPLSVTPTITTSSVISTGTSPSTGVAKITTYDTIAATSMPKK